MTTSFSQVTFELLRKEFQIKTIEDSFLPAITPVAAPDWLRHLLQLSDPTKTFLKSEKAISEAVIAPILFAVRERFHDKIGLFSGEPLVTEQLSGICDFIISTDPKSFIPETPIIVLVEAKKHDILAGIPQCVAEMYAAQQLNTDQKPVLGCVTTGLQWAFLKLENNLAITDSNILSIKELENILGVFHWFIQYRLAN
ncbi:MAG: hypothetical protein MUE30_13725 [Spirosomaceae bacterium]|jgi:hypothetical protein|nr:hypothetical protein [Spirosomataceae bacterium]